MIQQAKCDFCSDLAPAWYYPATDFVAFEIGPVVSKSEGSWAACDCCHDLIERGDRAGLAERSASMFVVANPESAEVIDSLRGELKRIHDLFFSNCYGTAQPLTSEVLR
ncbi:MAG: hypothetical protein K2X35_10160 [Bryobacteraceae bacterium]|nr:hypothetical protein [Bryobacteraceae bacterium]